MGKASSKNAENRYKVENSNSNKNNDEKITPGESAAIGEYADLGNMKKPEPNNVMVLAEDVDGVIRSNDVLQEYSLTKKRVKTNSSIYKSTSKPILAGSIEESNGNEDCQLLDRMLQNLGGRELQAKIFSR